MMPFHDFLFFLFFIYVFFLNIIKMQCFLNRRARRQRNRKDRTSRNFKAFKDASTNRRVMQREVALPDVRWRHSAPPKDEPEANKNKVKKRHIVFLKDSPDYCHASSLSKGVSMGAGHQGVLGRKCSADPNSPNPKAGIKKCAKLCRSCGLQVNS